MYSKKILLTGGSGNLGAQILKSGLSGILAPSHEELDICNPESIKRFFQNTRIDAIIHCAALARIQGAEKDPKRAVEVNISGTSNLVKQTLESENQARLLYISTDGVYPGTEGNYSELSPAIPYSIYGWTKLGGECVSRALQNHCIIRTSFYNADRINFETSPIDAFTSKLSIEKVVENIKFLLHSDFIGTVNVGGERQSYYELYRKINSNIKPCQMSDMKLLSPPLPKDCSMDISLLKRLKDSR